MPASGDIAEPAPRRLALLAITKPMSRPYMPWVPGRSWSTSTEPNWSGSSAITAAPAWPAWPTPTAEPMPANSAANAAPSPARS